MPIAYDLIADLCRHHAGYVIQKFSQSREPVRSWIAGIDRTQNGICQALAARWVVEHANGGTLWDWLGTRGAGGAVDRDAPDQSQIGRLMTDAIEFSVMNGPMANPTTMIDLSNDAVRMPLMGDLPYQDYVTSKYLRFWAGLIRRRLPQDHVQANVQAGTGGLAGLRLAMRLNRRTLLSPGGCYVMIGLTNSATKRGHAVSAFIGQDIAFFDSNFGEFYFGHRGTGAPTTRRDTIGPSSAGSWITGRSAATRAGIRPFACCPTRNRWEEGSIRRRANAD